jgi:hypothetical protein
MTAFFIAHVDADKRYVRRVKRNLLDLARTRAFRRVTHDKFPLTAKDIYFDEDSHDPTRGLASFASEAANASILILVVPRSGVRKDSYIRKELLAFLTGIEHSDRMTPDPETLTPEQCARGAERVPKVVLLDPFDVLLWSEGRCSGLGPIAETGCLAQFFAEERTRLRESAKAPRRAAAAALAAYSNLTAGQVAPAEVAIRRQRQAVAATMIVAFASLGGVLLFAQQNRKKDSKKIAEATRAKLVAERESALRDTQANLEAATQSINRDGHEWEGRIQLLAQRARIREMRVTDKVILQELDKAILGANRGVQVELDSTRHSFVDAFLVDRDSILVVQESHAERDASAQFVDATTGRVLLSVDGDFGAVSPYRSADNSTNRYLAAFDDGRVVRRDDSGALHVEDAIKPAAGSETWLSSDGTRLLEMVPDGERHRFKLFAVPKGNVIDHGWFPYPDTPSRMLMTRELPTFYSTNEGMPFLGRPTTGGWKETPALPGLRALAAAADGKSLFAVGENFVPVHFDANLRRIEALPDQMYGVQEVLAFPGAPSFLLTVGGRIEGHLVAGDDCSVYVWEKGTGADHSYRSFPVVSQKCDPGPVVAVARTGTRFAYGRLGDPVTITSATYEPSVNVRHVVEHDKADGDSLSLRLSDDGSLLVAITPSKVMLIDPRPRTPGTVDEELALLCARVAAYSKHEPSAASCSR